MRFWQNKKARITKDVRYQESKEVTLGCMFEQLRVTSNLCRFPVLQPDFFIFGMPNFQQDSDLTQTVFPLRLIILCHIMECAEKSLGACGDNVGISSGAPVHRSLFAFKSDVRCRNAS